MEEHDKGAEAVKPKHHARNELMEWLKAIIIAVIIVILIRWFLFTPTIVSGPSMLPNFEDRDRVILNKIIYSFREPTYGEVVVFHALEKKDYIKRVIALAGDRVKVEGDQVYVNGKVINEPYIQEQIDAAKKKGTTYNSMNFKVENGGIKEVIVPEGTVFVLGDNRPFSKDSRDPEVGFVSIDDIVGRADLVFWPPSKIKIIKHPDGMLE